MTLRPPAPGSSPVPGILPGMLSHAPAGRLGRRRAFTLIELLVVISIIALLIGILLPVLGSARKQARTMKCLVNLRSLGQAAQMYANDNKGAYPQPATEGGEVSSTWYLGLDGYLGLTSKNNSTSLNDIEDREYKQDPVWFDLEEENNNLTLKMNAYFGRPANPPEGLNGVRIVNGQGKEVGAAGFDRRTVFDSLIDQPSRTVVFGDGVADDIDLGNPQRDNFWMREFHVGLRHDGGANICFADGSASLVVQETDTKSATSGSGSYDVWYEEGSFNNVTFAANPQELVWKVRGRDYN